MADDGQNHVSQKFPLGAPGKAAKFEAHTCFSLYRVKSIPTRNLDYYLYNRSDRRMLYEASR